MSTARMGGQYIVSGDNHRVSQVPPALPGARPRGCCSWRARCWPPCATGRSIRPSIPSVGAAVERLVRRHPAGVAAAPPSRIGITPDTLMVEGAEANRDETAHRRSRGAAARSRSDPHHCSSARCRRPRSIACCASSRWMPRSGASAAVRRRSGPPRATRRSSSSRSTTRSCSRASTRATIAGRPVATTSGARSCCRSPPDRTAFDELAQQRLLDIAGSAVDIGDLASAVMAPKCAADGSPMITSQAATVLAAFRHLKSIVSVMAPDRLPDVMSNIATAAAQLDPHVVMQVMQTPEDPDDQRRRRQRDDRGVRRREGRAAAGDGAGPRRTGLGPAGHYLQHHCAGRGSQAPRADA